jgi:hypothetical protein
VFRDSEHVMNMYAYIYIFLLRSYWLASFMRWIGIWFDSLRPHPHLTWSTIYRKRGSILWIFACFRYKETSYVLSIWRRSAGQDVIADEPKSIKFLILDDVVADHMHARTGRIGKLFFPRTRKKLPGNTGSLTWLIIVRKQSS